ncbi:hypothetical protein MBLNU230_g3661t1 [Neophaeotheca triangularis]
MTFAGFLAMILALYFFTTIRDAGHSVVEYIEDAMCEMDPVFSLCVIPWTIAAILADLTSYYWERRIAPGGLLPALLYLISLLDFDYSVTCAPPSAPSAWRASPAGMAWTYAGMVLSIACKILAFALLRCPGKAAKWASSRAVDVESCTASSPPLSPIGAVPGSYPWPPSPTPQRVSQTSGTTISAPFASQAGPSKVQQVPPQGVAPVGTGGSAIGGRPSSLAPSQDRAYGSGGRTASASSWHGGAAAPYRGARKHALIGPASPRKEPEAPKPTPWAQEIARKREAALASTARAQEAQELADFEAYKLAAVCKHAERERLIRLLAAGWKEPCGTKVRNCLDFVTIGGKTCVEVTSLAGITCRSDVPIAPVILELEAQIWHPKPGFWSNQAAAALYFYQGVEPQQQHILQCLQVLQQQQQQQQEQEQERQRQARMAVMKAAAVASSERAQAAKAAREQEEREKEESRLAALATRPNPSTFSAGGAAKKQGVIGFTMA